MYVFRKFSYKMYFIGQSKKKLEYTVIEEVLLLLACGFEEYMKWIIKIDLTGTHLNKKYSFLH